MSIEPITAGVFLLCAAIVGVALTALWYEHRAELDEEQRHAEALEEILETLQALREHVVSVIGEPDDQVAEHGAHEHVPVEPADFERYR